VRKILLTFDALRTMLKRDGSLTNVKNVRRAEEALFKGGIPSQAVRLIRND